MRINFKIVVLSILILASVWFYFSKKNNNLVKNEDVDVAESVHSQAFKNVDKTLSSVSQSKVDQVMASEETVPKIQESSFEESLKQQGYTQDPDNPKYFIKWHTNSNGQKIKKMIDTTEGDAFEPRNIAVRDALETLASKKDLDPSNEITSLRRLDEKLQDNSMLMGTFRDEQNDVEIFMSSVQDLNGNPIEEDHGCFVWPKQQINFKKKINNGLIIRADETGYAVLKFSETRYARLMWSFEKKRTLHGELWEMKGGAYIKTNIFTATEIYPFRGDPVKYCESLK